jgi:hypothetical protein
VILETWWAYRHMCFNRRYGAVGLLGMPFYLVSEIVAPVFELVAITLLVVGTVSGHVEWWQFAGVTLAITLVNSVFNAGALLMVDLQARVYNKRALARLFVLMPLELVVYRPIMAWARLKGTWRFLRGDRAWHKFERNMRVEAT